MDISVNVESKSKSEGCVGECDLEQFNDAIMTVLLYVLQELKTETNYIKVGITWNS